MSSNDYIKVVYESGPIGEDKIILQLTTFDIEKYKKDQQLEQLPEQKKVLVSKFNRFEIDRPEFRFALEQRLEHIVRNEYEKQIKEMKKEIEYLRAIKIVPIEY